MLPIKRTARQRLETFANISRLKPDEETYDLERSVVGSVAAGTAADRCGQCGACDRTVVLVDVGNREADNMVMMPPLPQPNMMIVGEWFSRDDLLAYGRAVAEAKDAEIAALRADAARLDWIERHLFERKWDGTIGRPCDWYLVGPWRHWVQRMRGDTFRAAIDAALDRKDSDG